MIEIAEATLSEELARPMREYLVSPAFDFVEWDPSTSEMVIRFADGLLRSFAGVSREDFLAFADTETPGRYYLNTFHGKGR
ncbi:MAG: KTSC domain-containing protein [Proteobacteria bacterium]|nr:KTSC domain-containing protein [Pseudomonadota bacterium]